jgi:hypothetical protein
MLCQTIYYVNFKSFKLIVYHKTIHYNQGFHFQFCEVGGLTIISKGMSQIWLRVKQKSRKKLESCFVLVIDLGMYCLNMAIVDFFSHQNMQFW